MRKAEIITRKGEEYYQEYRRRRMRTWLKWYHALPHERKSAVIRRNRLYQYGLSLETYDVLLKKQCGACAICGGPNQISRHFSVDHDHATGKVRGLLYTVCNRQVAWFEKYRAKIEKHLISEVTR